MCKAQLGMTGTLDGVLRRRVKAEPGEHYVVVAFAVGVANRVLHLHRGHVADFWTDADRASAILLVTVHPFSFGVEEGRAGDGIEAAELHVVVAGEIDPAGLEQADDLVQVSLGVDHRRITVEGVQLVGRTANRRVGAVFYSNDAFHRERTADAHRASDDLWLIYQFFHLGVGGDASVDLVHLGPPGRAVGGKRVLQRLRPAGVGVERHFPFLPVFCARSGEGAQVGGLFGSKNAFGGCEVEGLRAGQNPAPPVRLSDRRRLLLTKLCLQFADQLLPQRFSFAALRLRVSVQRLIQPL